MNPTDGTSKTKRVSQDMRTDLISPDESLLANSDSSNALHPQVSNRDTGPSLSIADRYEADTGAPVHDSEMISPGCSLVDHLLSLDMNQIRVEDAREAIATIRVFYREFFRSLEDSVDHVGTSTSQLRESLTSPRMQMSDEPTVLYQEWVKIFNEIPMFLRHAPLDMQMAYTNLSVKNALELPSMRTAIRAENRTDRHEVPQMNWVRYVEGRLHLTAATAKTDSDSQAMLSAPLIVDGPVPLDPPQLHNHDEMLADEDESSSTTSQSSQRSSIGKHNLEDIEEPLVPTRGLRRDGLARRKPGVTYYKAAAGRLRAYREILKIPEQKIPLIAFNGKYHELQSICTPASVDITLCDFPLSVEELLTYFPLHTIWRMIAHRLDTHGWAARKCYKYITWTRELDDVRAVSRSVIQHQFSSAKKWHEGRAPQISANPATISKANGLRYSNSVLHDYFLVDLAEGVKRHPQGRGAQALTQAIHHTIGHNDVQVKLSEARMYVVSRDLFVPDPNYDAEVEDVATLPDLSKQARDYYLEKFGRAQI